MFETRSRARRARVDATLRKRSGPRRLTSPHNSSVPHHTHPFPALSQLNSFIMIFQWLADRALRCPFLNYLQGCLMRSELMQVPTVSSKSRGKSRCVRDGLTSYELLFTRTVSCPCLPVGRPQARPHQDSIRPCPLQCVPLTRLRPHRWSRVSGVDSVWAVVL